MIKKIEPQILGFLGLSVLIMVLARASESHLHLFSILKLNQTNILGFIFFASAVSFIVNREVSLDFQQKKVDVNYYIGYYLKVLFLILPAYWIVLTIMFLLNKFGIQTTGLIDNTESLLAYMTFIELSQHFYPIPVLLCYLLLVPIINYLLLKITQWDFVLIVFTILFLITVAEFINQNIPLSKFNILKYTSVFLIPSLVAYYVNFSKQIKSLNLRNQKTLNHFGSFSIIIFLLTFKSIIELIPNLQTSFRQQSFYIYYSILAMVIILASVYGNGILKRTLGSKSLQVLGTICIGIYLIHWPVLITLINTGDIADKYKIYIYLSLLIIFGFLSYFLVIRPIISMIEKHRNTSSL